MPVRRPGETVREVARHGFQVAHRELELSFASVGMTQGTETFTARVPANAVPGSVVARTRVAPRNSVSPMLKIQNRESLRQDLATQRMRRPRYNRQWLRECRSSIGI